MVKGVSSFSPIRLKVRVLTTEDKHFFSTSFGMCFLNREGLWMAMSLRVHISEINKSFCYDDVKRMIDDCLKDFADKEIIIMCFNDNNSNSLGRKYAAEKGFGTEDCPKRLCNLFTISDPAKSRKMVKRCDFLLLFREEENSMTDRLMENALRYCVPFKVKDL